MNPASVCAGPGEVPPDVRSAGGGGGAEGADQGADGAHAQAGAGEQGAAQRGHPRDPGQAAGPPPPAAEPPAAAVHDLPTQPVLLLLLITASPSPCRCFHHSASWGPGPRGPSPPAWTRTRRAICVALSPPCCGWLASVCVSVRVRDRGSRLGGCGRRWEDAVSWPKGLCADAGLLSCSSRILDSWSGQLSWNCCTNEVTMTAAEC